ncbi:MAG: hypothetical protein KDG55_00740 [Rhodocyclaceae bacterium]|nr:hypothetical protein [Rhodocyclaceae bacterium]
MKNVIRIAMLAVGSMALSPSFGHGPDQPEQAPPLVTTAPLGSVRFPITGTDAHRERFERGLAYLHHMMYALAEREFTALSVDAPDCAMAYWGIAMSRFHSLWVGRPSAGDYEAAAAALQKARDVQGLTEREDAYIEAASAFYEDWATVDYETRLARWEAGQRELHQHYPDDVDAATLYALAHLATAPKGDHGVGHQKAAGALLDDLFQRAPTHPGVLHYTIHAYDSAPLAARAVVAARAYDKIAPAVPHALHMPTHIFVRLGLWPDVIRWNARSARAALAFPAGDAISHHYPHALDYQVYANLQCGQDERAGAVMEEMFARRGFQKTAVAAYGLAAIPARVALERGDWRQAAALEVPQVGDFPWALFPQAEAITWFARGLGASRRGDASLARTALAELDNRVVRLRAAGEDYWARLVDAERQAVAAWLALTVGEAGEALAMMSDAADAEDSLDKHPVTPGAVLPARELYADMLLRLDRPDEALVAYEQSLANAPRRRNSLRGAAAAAKRTGRDNLAAEYVRRLEIQCEGTERGQRASIQMASP